MAERDEKIDPELIGNMRQVASKLKALKVPPSQGLQIIREYVIDYTEKSNVAASLKKGS